MSTLFFRIIAPVLIWLSGTALVHAADTWPVPEQRVRIIVPAARSVVVDPIARIVALQLSKRLGGQFDIAYMPGNYGLTGTAQAVKAAPDGSTLLLSWAGSLVISPNLFESLPFNAETSLEPIGLVAEIPNILVVNKHFPASTLGDFTSYVHKHPGAVNFGSTGQGRSMHLAGEMYMDATESNMVHVSYSSAELALSNLVSGQIESMFHLTTPVLKPIRDGQLRALGVMSAKRLPALPAVPTMAEQGFPELLSSVWFALSAPKGTPADVIRALNEALNAMLNDPEVLAQLDELGAVPMGGTPGQMRVLMASELKRWRQIVNTADLPFQVDVPFQ